MRQNITGTLKNSDLISMYEGATQLVQFDKPVPAPSGGQYSAAYVPGELSKQYNFPSGKRVRIETQIKGQEKACFVTSMSPL